MIYYKSAKEANNTLEKAAVEQDRASKQTQHHEDDLRTEFMGR